MENLNFVINVAYSKVHSVEALFLLKVEYLLRDLVVKWDIYT